MTFMQQYHAAKARHPGMVLLFRVGDFFELFGEDAEIAAKHLGLTLTRRDELSMAGFPHHSLEQYLQRLLKAGLRVAICEPVERPSASQSVERIVAPAVQPACVQPTLFDEEA